jgi:hypothetical protein
VGCATGEAKEPPLRPIFDRRIKLEFHGAKIVRHGRYVVFQLTEVAVPRALFADILRRIELCKAKPRRLWHEGRER